MEQILELKNISKNLQEVVSLLKLKNMMHMINQELEEEKLRKKPLRMHVKMNVREETNETS